MQLKFMTLNIWMGALLDNAIPFLHKEKPDILALQEVYDESHADVEKKYRTLSILQKELNYPFAVFSPTHREKNTGFQRGNAVLSRFPAELINATFLDVPYRDDYEDVPGQYEYCPRNIQHLQVNVQNKTLNIFNLHGIWGIDGKDSERRLEMSRVIVNEIKDFENIILAGDFNINPDTETIRTIEKHVINIFGNELKTTFNMQQKSNPGFATAVVDFIFASKNLNILEKSCPNVNVSDHLPLIITLEL